MPQQFLFLKISGVTIASDGQDIFLSVNTKGIFMDTLQVSKHELKLFVIAAVIVPVLCFILGFYSADKNSISTSNQDRMIGLLISSANANTANGSKAPVIEQSNNDTAKTASKEIKPSTNYLIQAGLYSNYQNATQYQATLLSNDIPTVISKTRRNGIPHYRVIIQSFESKQDASDFIIATKEKHNIDLYIAAINTEKTT